MKSVLRLLKLIAAVVTGFAGVKTHLDKVIEFLTFFAEDKHAEGYVWLRDSLHVRPRYDALEPAVRQAVDTAGPVVFEWIDVALPEEPILAFLKKIRDAIE